VSGPEVSIHVHVPFTENNIQQCCEKLGRYTEDPDKFMVEFQSQHYGFISLGRTFSSSWSTDALLQKEEKFSMFPTGRQIQPLLGTL
jgi:hypothetical protein